MLFDVLDRWFAARGLKMQRIYFGPRTNLRESFVAMVFLGGGRILIMLFSRQFTVSNVDLSGSYDALKQLADQGGVSSKYFGTESKRLTWAMMYHSEECRTLVVESPSFFGDLWDVIYGPKV
jgi:hypothetical protein